MGRLTKAWLWGAAFGAAALACATLIVRDSAGEGWHVLGYTAGLAALLLAALARYLVAVPGEGLTPRRGAALGALVTLLAHPLAWYLAILHHSLFGEPSSLGDAPLGVTDVPWSSFVFAFWSLLLTGWWTIPLGAGLGALLARSDRGAVRAGGEDPG